MRFTDNWAKSAHDHEANWRAWTGHLVAPRILEIGSFEGRSAVVWNLVHPTGTITCVDPFGGTAHGNEYERTFDENTAHLPVTKVRARSVEALQGMGAALFDVAYIDGDHSAGAALLDGLLAWPRLSVDGVLIFDDYEWRDGGPHQGDNPRAGVDVFLEVLAGQYELLGRGWQVAVRKTA